MYDLLHGDARREYEPLHLIDNLTPRFSKDEFASMSSGIETARLKDPEKIRAAVAAVRSASNA